MESTAAAAWQTFMADPKVRISLGILEVAGAWASIPATLGLAAAPGVVAGWRGIDEILGGLREIYNNEPNARSFTHMAVDLVTGDKSLTNKIVLATDFAIGGLSARQAAQNAAIKAEAKQAAIAARAETVTDDVANTARQTVHSYSGGTTRALEPVVAPNSAVTRTNAQLVQDIGTRAEAWGARRGLSATGSVEGTLKHGYADRLLTRYQRMFGDRGLSTEVRYINGRPWVSGDGLRGSIRLDVVEGAVNNPTAVFDYKFGNAVLSNSRINQIRRIGGIGPNVPITPIFP